MCLACFAPSFLHCWCINVPKESTCNKLSCTSWRHVLVTAYLLPLMVASASALHNVRSLLPSYQRVHQACPKVMWENNMARRWNTLRSRHRPSWRQWRMFQPSTLQSRSSCIASSLIVWAVPPVAACDPTNAPASPSWQNTIHSAAAGLPGPLHRQPRAFGQSACRELSPGASSAGRMLAAWQRQLAGPGQHDGSCAGRTPHRARVHGRAGHVHGVR